MNQLQPFPLASSMKYSMSTKVVTIAIFVVDGQFKKWSTKVTSHLMVASWKNIAMVVLFIFLGFQNFQWNISKFPKIWQMGQ
jgi:FtsH-binding integral membrane protein